MADTRELGNPWIEQASHQQLKEMAVRLLDRIAAMTAHAVHLEAHIADLERQLDGQLAIIEAMTEQLSQPQPEEADPDIATDAADSAPATRALLH